MELTSESILLQAIRKFGEREVKARLVLIAIMRKTLEEGELDCSRPPVTEDEEEVWLRYHDEDPYAWFRSSFFGSRVEQIAFMLEKRETVVKMASLSKAALENVVAVMIQKGHII
jgi:hypothetical protein